MQFEPCALCVISSIAPLTPEIFERPQRPPSPYRCLVYFPLHNLQLRNCKAEKLRNSFPLLPGEHEFNRSPRDVEFDAIRARNADSRCWAKDLICIMCIISRWEGQLGDYDLHGGTLIFRLVLQGAYTSRMNIMDAALVGRTGKRRIFRLRNINPLVSFVRIPETFMR